jgi:hypothetical protein
MTSPLVTPDLRPFEMRGFIDYCEICDAHEFFVIGGLGLVARCLGCGDERVLLGTKSEGR